MATRDLSRTIVEPARAPHLKEWRRESIRSERMHVRRYLAEIARDSDHAEECDPSLRRPVRPDFGCHLRPLRRWLSGRVGQPWDAVFHELCERFDRRTFRGRHIVDQHVFRHLVDARHGRRIREWSTPDFFVDDDGILRYEPYRRGSGARPEKSAVSQKVLKAWLAGRKVGRRDSKLFWFVPVRRYVWNSVYLPEYQGYMEFRERVDDRWCFRQDRPLTRDEVAFYERIPAWKQAEIAEGLVIEPVERQRSVRPSDFRLHRIPAPGAPPLKIDDEAA
jgi:hypothetical protein